MLKSFNKSHWIVGNVLSNIEFDRTSIPQLMLFGLILSIGYSFVCVSFVLFHFSS